MHRLPTSVKLLVVVFGILASAITIQFLAKSHQVIISTKVVGQTKDETIKQNLFCKASLNKNSCLTDSYESYAKQSGALAALELLHHDIESDQELRDTCHEIMHHIGHVAAHEFGGIQQAYVHGNIDCGNGYFHGVVEEVLRSVNPVTLTPIEIQHLCDGIAVPALSTKEFATRNCVHGIGHALVYKNNGVLTSALETCVDIAGDTHRAECLAGAFMENMIEKLPLGSENNPTKNPSLICSTIVGDAYRCWTALSGYVISEEHKGLTESLAFCQSFSSSTYRSSCGEGLGKAVMLGRTESASEAYCTAHASSLAPDCIRGSRNNPIMTSPFYSVSFKQMQWGSSTGTDPLIGNIGVIP